MLNTGAPGAEPGRSQNLYHLPLLLTVHFGSYERILQVKARSAKRLSLKSGS